MTHVETEYRELESQILAAMREGWSEARCESLMLEVFAFQRRWNEPYAKFCRTRPEPTTWREIPAVPQSAFKTAHLSVARERVTKTFLTSGTTGEARGAHHFLDTRLYEQAVLHGWNLLGLKPLPQFVLTPEAAEAPQSSLAHMMLVLGTVPGWSQHCVDGAGQLQFDELTDALEPRIEEDAPVALLGTALAFLGLFERLGAERLKLPAHSYALETGGYKGSGREIPKEELYAMFGEYLGLAPEQVLNEYGMTELSSQFYTRGLGGVHQGPPWLRALVIDPETGAETATGETGVLRIFDLANLGSVLALDTQDLAVRHEHGFKLLGRDPAALPRGCSRAADERMRA